MSYLDSPYGESECVKWSHIHSEKCSDETRLKQFLQIVQDTTEKALMTLQGDKSKFRGSKRNLMLQKIVQKVFLAFHPMEKFFFDTFAPKYDDEFKAMSKKIIDSYAMFYNGASTLDEHKTIKEDKLYNLHTGEIPSRIINALRYRVNEGIYKLLGLTCEGHYRDVMNAISKHGSPLRIGRHDTHVVVKGDEVILQVPVNIGKNLGFQSYHGSNGIETYKGILAQEKQVRSPIKVVRHFIAIPESAYSAGSRVIKLFD